MAKPTLPKPPLARPGLIARFHAVRRVWPLRAALFLILAFFITLAWFANIALMTVWTDAEKWLEPLAALSGGFGAFLIVWILIGERIQEPVVKANEYRLARGLAAGYHFNFIRPMAAGVTDPASPLRVAAAEKGAREIAGFLIAIPQSIEDCDPANHEDILTRLTSGGIPFRLHKISVIPAGRPRGIGTFLAVSSRLNNGIIIDIPSTLAVLPEYGRFFAERETRSGADEQLVPGRISAVVAATTDEFVGWTRDFTQTLFRFSTDDPSDSATDLLVHVVPLNLLRRRMDEVAGH